jgi:hypothetical protein
VILVAVIIFMVIVAIAVTTLVVLARRPQESAAVKLLRQHAYYTAQAAKASRKGSEGEMNVYMEAAKDLDVLEHFSAQTGRMSALDPVRQAVPRVPSVVEGRQRVPAYSDTRIPAHLLERAAEARRKVQEQS